MIILIVIAITGWFAAILMAILYRVGNRSNAADEAALESLVLILAFSDNVREGIRSGYEQSIRESKAVDIDQVQFGMLGAANRTAKGLYDIRTAEESGLFSPAIVHQLITEIRERGENNS
jgi:hypothetical protein